jgi:glycosyltransferase involved in cell wall biosynthesis
VRIWHTGATASADGVSGVNAVVWLVGAAQAAAGHDVTLVVDDATTEDQRVDAERRGVRLLESGRDGWPRGAPGLRPDVVHVHSVFMPRQIGLAIRLARRGIPYVVTPHGGLGPDELARRRHRKAVYAALVERRRVRRAAAVTALTAAERRAVVAFCPAVSDRIVEVPNPVDDAVLESGRWRGDLGGRRAVFLGRFDVEHKGLDRVGAVAASAPEWRFELFGRPDEGWAELVAAGLPPNVHVHEPVHGEAKLEILRGASVYLQLSRWEGFSVSLAEAMAIGIPCAVAPAPYNEGLVERDLVTVLPSSPAQAASVLDSAVSTPEAWTERAARARAHAAGTFSPASVASAYLEAYRSAVLSSS